MEPLIFQRIYRIKIKLLLKNDVETMKDVSYTES